MQAFQKLMPKGGAPVGYAVAQGTCHRDTSKDLCGVPIPARQGTSTSGGRAVPMPRLLRRLAGWAAGWERVISMGGSLVIVTRVGRWCRERRAWCWSSWSDGGPTGRAMTLDLE